MNDHLRMFWGNKIIVMIVIMGYSNTLFCSQGKNLFYDVALPSMRIDQVQMILNGDKHGSLIVTDSVAGLAHYVNTYCKDQAGAIKDYCENEKALRVRHYLFKKGVSICSLLGKEISLPIPELSTLGFYLKESNISTERQFLRDFIDEHYPFNLYEVIPKGIINIAHHICGQNYNKRIARLVENKEILLTIAWLMARGINANEPDPVMNRTFFHFAWIAKDPELADLLECYSVDKKLVIVRGGHQTIIKVVIISI